MKNLRASWLVAALWLALFMTGLHGSLTHAAPAEPMNLSAGYAPDASTSLVVNEVEVRIPGADDAEFVEISNVGGQTVNLAEYALVGVSSDGVPYRRDRLPARLLSTGQYFVVGSSGAPNVDLVVGDVDIWADQDSFPNQAAAIGIVRNSTDDDRLDVGVDSLSYGGTVPGGPLQGGSWSENVGFDPGDPGDTARQGMSRGADGVDTDDNSVDFSLRCITPGYKNTGPGAAGCGAPPTVTPTATADLGTQGLVVNEIDYLQPLGVHGDFVEILNKSATAIDLGSYYLLGIDGRVMPPVEYRRDRLPQLTLGAGQMIVLGNQDVTNVTVDLGTVDIWESGDTTGPMGIAIVENPSADPLNDRLVDSLSYEGSLLGGPALGGTWTERAGFGGTDGTDENDVSLGRFPHGNDNNLNSRDWSIHCASPGLANGNATAPCAPPPTHTPVGGASATLTPTETATVDVTPTNTPTATSDVPSPTPTLGPPGPDRFIVDSARDDDDADPGDGRCLTRLGECTLRAALRQAAFRSGLEWLSIEFTGPMDISVPSDRPLPGLVRRYTIVTGAAHFRGGVPGVRIIGPRRSRNIIAESGQPSPATPFIGFSVGTDAVLQGLSVSGFDIGVVIAETAHRALIGSNQDGLVDEREGLVIEDNTMHGVVLEGRSRASVVAGNVIRRNPGYGILAWDGYQHAGNQQPGLQMPGSRFTQNRISNSGSAAIGFYPGAGEIARPVVRGVDLIRGIVAGLSCPGCKVEVFADDGDEAATYLGDATTDDVGLWRATDLDLSDVANLTATTTDTMSNTSRLSAPFPAQAAWKIFDRTPFRPRLIFANQTLRRTLRVLDDRDRPADGVRLEFRPSLVNAIADANGDAEVVIPIPALVDPGESLALSMSGIFGPAGRHSSDWIPRFVVGQADSGPGPSDTKLVLTGLGALNFGLTFTGQLAATRDVAPNDERGLTPGSQVEGPGPQVEGAGAQIEGAGAPNQGAEVFGAGMIASPADLREGSTSWQENMAYGGGIYEISAPAAGASGTIEIVAPIEAFGDGPSAQCGTAPEGATVAGWSKDRICWQPVPNSEQPIPEQDASTFVSRAPVTISGSTTISILQATIPYTLYTVGFDNTPPVITPTLGIAGPGGELPAIVALATDHVSGINIESVEVSLDGVPIPAIFDPATEVVRLVGGTYPIPNGGTPQLRIALSDGFCNQTSTLVALLGGGKIFLPITRQR